MHEEVEPRDRLGFFFGLGTHCLLVLALLVRALERLHIWGITLRCEPLAMVMKAGAFLAILTHLVLDTDAAGRRPPLSVLAFASLGRGLCVK